jgi:hypothetical protein
MKKISIALMLFVTVIGTAFANDRKDLPDFKGSQHFTRNFPGATGIDCKITGLFTKVDFTWRELKLEVFYDKEGNLLATCRKIPFSNLPLALQLSLNTEYAGMTPTEVSEFDDANDGLCYYVTVADTQKTYILRLSVSGSISVFRKIKK